MIRPGAKDHGFGQVTPRIVDLLHRTKTWTRAIAVISFLGVAAFLALGGFAWLQAEKSSPAFVILGFAGVLALAVLVLAFPLYRFAQAVEQITLWNRGPSVASAFEHLGTFWRRAGILVATFLFLAIAAWLALVWLAQSDPQLAAVVAAVRDPQGFSRQQEERRQEQLREEGKTLRDQPIFVLKTPRFGKETPRWAPAPNPPAAPGRSFKFDEIGEACRIADTTFVCLINRPGELVAGGSRQVITGDDAIFTVLPQTEGFRPLLEISLAGRERPWRLRLGPPMGFPLMKMTYNRTVSYEHMTQRPFLELSAIPLSCRGGSGSKFQVQEIAWGSDGLPDRLVVDFEVECDASPPAVGRLSIASE